MTSWVSDFWRDTIQGWGGVFAAVLFVIFWIAVWKIGVWQGARDRACHDGGGFWHEGQCLDRKILIDTVPTGGTPP